MRQAGLLLTAALFVALPAGAAAADPLPSPPSLHPSPGWQLVASYGMTGPHEVTGDVELRTGAPFAIIAACRGATDLIVLLGPPPADGVWSGRAFEFPCSLGDEGFLTTRVEADSATAGDVLVRVLSDQWPDRVMTVLLEQEEHPAPMAPSPSPAAPD